MARRKRKAKNAKRNRNDDLGFKKGYKQFIADRGSFSFYFPRRWVHIPGRPPMIQFYDKKPPNYDCILSVTCLKLPESFWKTISIVEQLQNLVDKEKFEVVATGGMFREPRDDFDLAWTELCLVDPDENRNFICRYCIAQGKTLQVLMIFKFWASKVKRFDPIWDEIRYSLMLERYVRLPEVGW